MTQSWGWMHLRCPSILQVKILEGLDPGKWEKREINPEPKLTECTVGHEGKPPASQGGQAPFLPRPEATEPVGTAATPFPAIPREGREPRVLHVAPGT